MKRYRPRALDPDDPADEVRGIAAAWTLLQLLVRDPRVHRARNAWLGTVGANRCVALVLTDDEAASVAWEQERQSAARAFAASLAPFEARRRMSEKLADFFLDEAVAFVTGGSMTVGFRLGRAWALKKRRAVKGGLAGIRRDVRWYYLARIQEPPVSLHQLAREYAEAEGRRTSARSVVQDGIARAETLLKRPSGAEAPPSGA